MASAQRFYRIVPVHPNDQPLLVEGALYIDSALPFGLRSAPIPSLVDSLEWRLIRMGLQQLFHYLDNFLILVPLQSSQCKEVLQVILRGFGRLGVPVVEANGSSLLLHFRHLTRYNTDGMKPTTTQFEGIKQAYSKVIAKITWLLSKEFTITNWKIATCMQGGLPRNVGYNLQL